MNSAITPIFRFPNYLEAELRNQCRSAHITMGPHWTLATEAALALVLQGLSLFTTLTTIHFVAKDDQVITHGVQGLLELLLRRNVRVLSTFKAGTPVTPSIPFLHPSVLTPFTLTIPLWNFSAFVIHADLVPLQESNKSIFLRTGIQSLHILPPMNGPFFAVKKLQLAASLSKILFDIQTITTLAIASDFCETLPDIFGIANRNPSLHHVEIFDPTIISVQESDLEEMVLRALSVWFQPSLVTIGPQLATVKLLESLLKELPTPLETIRIKC